MSRTYSCRRREVVGQSMQVAELKERWPALFDPVQINDEFRRCNTVPLESTFISQLDRYTPKLLELFNSKRGAVRQRMKSVLVQLIKDPDVVKKRDMTLRCLIEYMGESVQELISDYSRTPEDKVHKDLKAQRMRIYVCQQPDAVGIIIDGTPVLTGLDNVPRACCLLLGLTYSLNLDYPPKLAKTFKVFQRGLSETETAAETNIQVHQLEEQAPEPSRARTLIRPDSGSEESLWILRSTLSLTVVQV